MGVVILSGAIPPRRESSLRCSFCVCVAHWGQREGVGEGVDASLSRVRIRLESSISLSPPPLFFALNTRRGKTKEEASRRPPPPPPVSFRLHSFLFISLSLCSLGLYFYTALGAFLGRLSWRIFTPPPPTLYSPLCFLRCGEAQKKKSFSSFIYSRIHNIESLSSPFCAGSKSWWK